MISGYYKLQLLTQHSQLFKMAYDQIWVHFKLKMERRKL